VESERCLLLLEEVEGYEEFCLAYGCAPSRRMANAGGGPPDGALYLWHGLNDMRLRGPRGSPEVFGC
jgi:hypothetical protein